uniref:Uncharacterized protein n=1 Tax=Strix occidentalis caurina TaxID=311401 RepID=A0A8D0FY87_STROC
VKKILIEMEDQKQTYEQKAKEALQKMLEDKLQTEQQLQNSQRSLAATREDLAFWKEHYTTLKAELTKMTAAHTELENSLHGMQSELQVRQLPTGAASTGLQRALHSLQSEHAALHQRASALREDNDLKAEHIDAIKGIVGRGMVGGSVLHLNGGYMGNTLKILVLKAKYTHAKGSLALCCAQLCQESFWFPKGS